MGYGLGGFWSRLVWTRQRRKTFHIFILATIREDRRIPKRLNILGLGLVKNTQHIIITSIFQCCPHVPQCGRYMIYIHVPLRILMMTGERVVWYTSIYEGFHILPPTPSRSLQPLACATYFHCSCFIQFNISISCQPMRRMMFGKDHDSRGHHLFVIHNNWNANSNVWCGYVIFCSDVASTDNTLSILQFDSEFRNSLSFLVILVVDPFPLQFL